MTKDYFSLLENKELIVFPSKTSSQNDFDFLQGNWIVHNRKLKSRLSGCQEWTEFDARQDMQKVLGGMGNIDFMRTTVDGKYYEGMAVRLFDPKARLWSIYWADNQFATLEKPVLGSFEGDTGQFFCKDIFAGKEILVRFNWDTSDKQRPIWSQAFSDDGGQNWEWNWYMYLEKIS